MSESCLLPGALRTLTGSLDIYILRKGSLLGHQSFRPTGPRGRGSSMALQAPVTQERPQARRQPWEHSVPAPPHVRGSAVPEERPLPLDGRHLPAGLAKRPGDILRRAPWSPGSDSQGTSPPCPEDTGRENNPVFQHRISCLPPATARQRPLRVHSCGKKKHGSKGDSVCITGGSRWGRPGSLLQRKLWEGVRRKALSGPRPAPRSAIPDAADPGSSGGAPSRSSWGKATTPRVTGNRKLLTAGRFLLAET